MAAAGADKIVRVWEILKGPHSIAPLRGHKDKVNSVAFLRNSKQLLSTSRDKTMRLWNLATRHEAWPLPNESKAVWAAVFSPDEQKILTGCDDNIVRLYGTKSAKRIREMKGHTGAVHAVAYRPVGKNKALNQALSAGWDKTVRLWDLNTGKEVRQFKGHTQRVNSVAFSPDGNQAVSAGGDCVRLWQVNTGKQLHAFPTTFGEMLGVAFAPDGRRFLAAGRDTRIYLWDLQKKYVQTFFTGHSKPVTGLAFSADGRTFASCSEDATVRIWGVPPVQ